ncbi:ankyrin repeat domain-containing protein [Anaeramoeba flamelloides]|uniref:Ankyrin repeat domain-containing protein n=1 Tax=Anaeramoeba flamelloides TaxID=1746091 RepID=A0AAV7ZJX5_9EUKA|nr:ankyrin repeat domain-containing protein [Anaeramoeba flamelloides]KAJ6231787.1 ankyrin repeat domain-containing protein [Anaeramoeba flamelloides]
MNKNTNEFTPLDDNPFFQRLKKKFKSLYKKANDECYTICVPDVSCLIGAKINRSLIELHILRESPYFSGEFITLAKDTKSVLLKPSVIELKRGFDKRRKINILSREQFYNNKYEPFEILILDSQLGVENPKVALSKRKKEKLQMITNLRDEALNRLPPNITKPEAINNYFRGFQHSKGMWVKIVEKVKKFERSYMLAKGYEEEARERVEALSEYSIKRVILQNEIFKSFPEESYIGKSLREMVKIYISVQLDYWGKIIGFYTEEDRLCTQQFQKLSTMPIEESGIEKKFITDFSKAISCFKKMHKAKSPQEKLNLLDETLTLINNLVGEKVGNSDSIATDDLIPIMSFVVIRAGLKNPITTIQYLTNFSLCDYQTSKMGFEITLLDSIVNSLIANGQLYKIWKDENDSKSEKKKKKKKKNNENESSKKDQISNSTIQPLQNFDLYIPSLKIKKSKNVIIMDEEDDPKKTEFLDKIISSGSKSGNLSDLFN